MHTVNQSTKPLVSNYASVLEAALKEYKKLTKQDLHTHPFAVQLGNCKSADDVLDIFQKQAEVFDEFCKGDARLMKWLGPIVHLLFVFSGTLAEGVSLVGVKRTILSISLTHLFVSLFRPQKHYSLVSVFSSG
jgi:fungal STAND N-terminal Goodbye domain